MTYLTITHVPGGDLAGYHSILDALPDTEPDGLIARYAGPAGDDFVITAVWTTKAKADRFAVEILGPTVRASGATSSQPPRTVEYQTAEEFVVGAATTG